MNLRLKYIAQSRSLNPHDLKRKHFKYESQTNWSHTDPR